MIPEVVSQHACKLPHEDIQEKLESAIASLEAAEAMYNPQSSAGCATVIQVQPTREAMDSVAHQLYVEPHCGTAGTAGAK